MKSQRRIHIAWYIFSDFMMSALAWAIFFIFRKLLLGEPLHFNDVFTDINFWMGIVLIPAGWILLHALFGTYESFYTKSRLNELILSFFTTFIGSMILFFLFILDDGSQNHRYYYEAYFLLWSLCFLLQFSGRLTLLTMATSTPAPTVQPALLMLPPGNSGRVALMSPSPSPPVK